MLTPLSLASVSPPSSSLPTPKKRPRLFWVLSAPLVKLQLTSKHLLQAKLLCEIKTIPAK